MKIEKDRVVRFHYTVAEQGSEALESSKDREPLAILAGHGNIIPGLEKAMEGREAGDTFSADVPAAEAYGERRDNLTQRVGMSVVDVDHNHPMAGKDLRFDIEVVEVREATAEELEHGHVHGEGGHHH